jgi:protein phosphatase
VLNAALLTHTGRVRPHNEDNALCRPAHGLFAVVDGMGGEAAGEVAAAMAVAALTEVSPAPRLAGETVLAQALHTARERIVAEAERNPACARMGAVVTAARFDDRGNTISLAHVGDTRAWLINGSGVVQLTEDHVAAQPDPGRNRPAVTRDLGRRDLAGDWVQTRRVAVRKGDLFVLASDGLHDPVGAEELGRELAKLWESGADAESVCARLVALALARGGPDNVTVLAVRVGTFRRGRTTLRRLGWPATFAVLGLLTLAVVAANQLRGDPVQAGIPPVVKGHVALNRDAVYPLTSPTTKVEPAGVLHLRGVEVTGAGWTLEVAPGGRVELMRSLVHLDGELTVLLGAGATLAATDTRFDVAALRVSGAGGAVLWDHATLPSVVVIDAAHAVSGVEQVPPPGAPP